MTRRDTFREMRKTEPKVKESLRKGQNQIKTEQKWEADSLLLTPMCCDDIHDVTPRVSALAGCDRLGTRLVVPNDATLREALLIEAHSSPFSLHPGSTKMYHDLKQYFWWSGMKGDVAMFVARLKKDQEKDKIRSKRDKNGKRGEAGKNQKQLQ
uniref:Putative reverse transcriptase domain-containing protein n=1 Tax=Tanacetum cinerariifolium TaxID=118510 RepID=A0A6L2NU45_TANCI|nr:putative reverse transcriptase domain-containing protein [Tanacetum cinerariifolium]